MAAPSSDASRADANIPSTTITTTISTLLREFTITVVLSFLCLLALLFTIQYHIRLFLRGGELPPTSSCPSCTRMPCPHTSSLVSLELNTLSPLDVLKITVACAMFVFGSMELIARALGRPGLSPLGARSPGDINFDDAEAGTHMLPPLEKPPVSRTERPLPSPPREASLLPL